MINNNYAITFTFLVATLFFTLGLTTSQAATALENYDHYCAQCHGAEGKGDGINATDEMPVSPRNHTDPKEMGKLTSEDVYFAIKDGGKSVGKSSLMPRWGATMDDGDIKALVEHLNTLCNCKYKAK
ncbi:MAG: c-type cytochrome [Pseudomonadota bacterium]